MNLTPNKAWTEQEIHDLVIGAVGVDEVFPRGYLVLIKLLVPSVIDDAGMHRTDQMIKDINRSTMIGQILRMGPDAFKDEVRFPGGPTVSHGEWCIFRGSERQRIRLNGVDMAFVNDDRFLGVTTAPAQLETVFDMIHEHMDS